MSPPLPAATPPAPSKLERALLTAALPALAALLLGAHFLRAGRWAFVLLSLVAPALVLVPRPWARPWLRILLTAGALRWLHTTWVLVQARTAVGAPWLRMAAILGGVALFTVAAAALLPRWRQPEPEPDREHGARPAGQAWGSLLCVVITTGVLAGLQLGVQRPLLLAERLLPGLGWLQAAALGLYAGFVHDALRTPAGAARARPWLWRAFSVLFFVQLLLGVAGVQQLLMSGRLHLPVPALILAGPLYRGGGLFMPLLFGITVLLVGPAWCSWLCYVGCWDDVAARGGPGRPKPAPRWWTPLRWALLVLVILVPLGLRWGGARATTAVALGAAFGVAGVAVMVGVSRRRGLMAHCTVWCPMGLVANLLGRLSPFRLHISEGCDACGACSRTCRYSALQPEHLARRRVGLTCTLCGDCLPSCRAGHLGYGLPGLSGRHARAVFFVMISVLHALFMGVARM